MDHAFSGNRTLGQSEATRAPHAWPSKRIIPSVILNILPSSRGRVQQRWHVLCLLRLLSFKVCTIARCCRLCNPRSVSHLHRFTNITTDCRTVRDWWRWKCKFTCENSGESSTFQTNLQASSFASLYYRLRDPEEENVDGCHDWNMVFVPWLHSSLSQLALSSYVMVAGLRLMDNLKQIQVEK